MSKKVKSGKTYHARRYGILNPYGDIWTADTFSTAEEAKRRVTEFWAFDPRRDLSMFAVVPVSVIVSVVG